MRRFENLPAGTPARPWASYGRYIEDATGDISVADAETKENAVSIVQAINDHDALVDEVERLRGLLAELCEDTLEASDYGTLTLCGDPECVSCAATRRILEALR